ncbi:hypothetical protein EVAR_26428_1 [Eumeta japonica]|uniref:Uncharacterized protein n=1 Tax=Eumeta variegata TaxID=151549 RepID=A0A4C1VSH0_EUMVA|nr:hypothetical protein EVAR_26428_1 [Eumeta japonica]
MPFATSKRLAIWAEADFGVGSQYFPPSVGEEDTEESGRTHNKTRKALAHAEERSFQSGGWATRRDFNSIFISSVAVPSTIPSLNH